MTKKKSNPPADSENVPEFRDYPGIAHKYAVDVISGAVPAGKGVRSAAQRHLDDLARPSTFPYKFSAVNGTAVCLFVELLPHTKGRWAAKKERIVLEPWQCFLLVVGFGWLNKSNDKRRFRRFYWEIPRKNGKSILAAALGLYMFGADGEHGSEIYSGATTEAQAWEVFAPAKAMMEREPMLTDAFGATVAASRIVKFGDGSKFHPVIGKPGDGSSPSCAIIDEFHEHDTPDLYDTMETGMGAREQPLLLVITTAGTNIAGPCHEMHDEVTKILEGTQENDQVFGVIFSVDAEDDWASPASLRKANPNFDVSVDGEFLLAQQRQAMMNPMQQARFRTKHLNVWTSVYAGVMNMQQWKLCGDELLDEDDLAGNDLWIAVDLASKSDLCSEQRLYRKTDKEKPHYYLFGRYWLPEDAIEEEGPNHAAYSKWVKTGHLIQTEGATVDFELITETLIADCKKFDPTETVFDPFNAVQMMQRVMEQKITAVEFVQTPQNFAVPLDELLTAVKDGRFHHDGNPITAWCMSNMVARPSKKGLISPIKQKPHQKIDGAIAAVMAIARAAAAKDKAKKFQMIVF